MRVTKFKENAECKYLTRYLSAPKLEFNYTTMLYNVERRRKHRRTYMSPRVKSLELKDT